MNKLKILTVDDDPDILDVLLATLDGDYEVIQASNGQEAINKAKETSPDLSSPPAQFYTWKMSLLF